MHVKELFDLKDQVALITGGGRGLGKQIAEAYAEMGCHLALCSRKKEVCEETAEIFRNKYNVIAKSYELDVTNESMVEDVVNQVLEDFGKIDILVNNSGATWGAPVEEMPLEAWNKVLNVNVTGTFLMSRAVGRHMIERKSGKIINIASAAGLTVRPPEITNTIGYTTSKAAVIHFTKDLAIKWARHNIHVNAIAPGMFRTKMTKGTLEQKEKEILERIPLRKIGDENMLKGAALYLATKASDFVTGTVLSVDGGSTL
ncbi:SDR family oxidoreductase [Calidifontibacillus erzurumensis]|uniref:SDR family oxidoreductase n=1 Tax=Calidifontibacillus erzurumensis TaxID=2741433 RepID=A0A8J8KEC8_9BACI|nr:SDR family oxidoreductase [Calidifontibacillus erzurumensis]NSL51685.1 SDR family oxidoreductase [Calidifontibacillus erzurumensis]